MILGAIPHPPVNFRMPDTTGPVFTVVSLALAASAIVYALYVWRRDRSPIAILLIAGGGLSALLEPLVDINGGCWYPRSGGWPAAFHLYGTPVAIWGFAAYFWFVGGQAIIAVRLLTRRPERTTIWKICAGVAVVNFLLETPGLSLHIYRYWGHQPLNPYGWPLWWIPVNVGLPLVGALFVYKLQPVLTGPRLLLIVLLMPLGDGLSNGAIAWPAWLALNSNWPMPIADLAGIAVFGLAALFYWVFGHLIFPSPGLVSTGVVSRGEEALDVRDVAMGHQPSVR